MGRCGLLTLLLLLPLGGCLRWSGYGSVKTAVLREGLMNQRIPDGFKAGLAQTSAGLDCRIGGDLVERCRANVNSVSFDVRDGVEGGEILVPKDATERQITTFWRALDPENYRAFEQQLPSLIAERVSQEDARFEPRWGLVAGVSTTVNPLSPTTQLGGRVGVRRWWSINFGTHAAVDYLVQVGTDNHQFGLRLGLDLTRFTAGRFLGYVGAPPWAIYGFMGPRLRVPGPVGGVRSGVGLMITDWKMAPLIVEFSADTWFQGEQSRVEFAITVGLAI